MCGTFSAVVLAFVVTEVANSIPPRIPNFISRDYELEIISEYHSENTDDNLKILLVEGTNAFIGTKNNFFYVSLLDMTKISSVQWLPPVENQCRSSGRPVCNNYIRVLARMNDTRLFVCGTNAFKPECRYYNFANGTVTATNASAQSGVGLCPFDESYNSTFLYNAGQFYAGTISDSSGRESVIVMKDVDNNFLRTYPRDPTVLNDANFVSSHEKDDKVYFFFREVAVDLVGEVTVSRVARVCRKDKGTAFSSYFKTRLSCYLPGITPFYFDEIQSTSEFGLGHIKPIADAKDRVQMIYGLFNMAEIGVGGSAVCAFTLSDITKAFGGPFKGQESYFHKWMPVKPEMTPSPHPSTCVDVNTTLHVNTKNFIKGHPLMDNIAKPWGDTPVFIFHCIRSKLTYMAVDWQVKASDGRYHDVIYAGTNDGRVIKFINKGTGDKVTPMIIEDVQVLRPGDAVVDMRVLRDAKLLVVSAKRYVVTISLQRCHRAETYEFCMALQDPYCTCINYD